MIDHSYPEHISQILRIHPKIRNFVLSTVLLKPHVQINRKTILLLRLVNINYMSKALVTSKLELASNQFKKYIRLIFRVSSKLRK